MAVYKGIGVFLRKMVDNRSYMFVSVASFIIILPYRSWKNFRISLGMQTQRDSHNGGLYAGSKIYIQLNSR